MRSGSVRLALKQAYRLRGQPARTPAPGNGDPISATSHSRGSPGDAQKHPGRNVIRSRESEANQGGKGGSSQKTTLDLLYRLEWNLRPQTWASAATPIETSEYQASRTSHAHPALRRYCRTDTVTHPGCIVLLELVNSPFTPTSRLRYCTEDTGVRFHGKRAFALFHHRNIVRPAPV